MKTVIAIGTAGVTFAVAFLIAIFSFLPPKDISVAGPALPTDTPPPVVPMSAPTVGTSQTEATIAARETVYLTQIAQLEQALQQRQGTYQEQLHTLGNQLALAQEQLTQVKTQEQALQTQIADLENTRTERLSTYQTQLEQAQTEYSARFAQMQGMINELQTKLAEANAQLGR